MSKKSISLIVFILVVSFGIISLYTTFAYNEEEGNLEVSNADYNLIYSLKNAEKQQVNVGIGEEKYVDITLTNTYDSTVRYGACYKMINPKKVPNGLTVKFAEQSSSNAEALIEAGETVTITIKITNNSEYDVSMVVGTLIGFENGDISDLLTTDEILIK